MEAGSSLSPRGRRWRCHRAEAFTAGRVSGCVPGRGRSGAEVCSEVVLREGGEALLLDAFDQRTRPSDDPGRGDAVRRVVGVAFDALGGAAQQLYRSYRVSPLDMGQTDGELR